MYGCLYDHRMGLKQNFIHEMYIYLNTRQFHTRMYEVLFKTHKNF